MNQHQVKHENRLKEYEMLRAEILQKIDLHNSLVTFTITATNAILAYALFQSKNASPYSFLLPFGIIIPMSLRISYYRTGMMKLAAYIEAVIEPEEPGLEWEKRNTNALFETIPFMGENDLFFKKKKCKVFSLSKTILGKHIKSWINGTYARNNECFILSIMCYVLFLNKWIRTKSLSPLNFTSIISILFPLLFVLWEYFICRYSNRVVKERQQWKKIWLRTK